MMNDRIRELLVESGFCFWADEEWGPGPGKVSWDCDYEKEMEKFVELLVGECTKEMTDQMFYQGIDLGSNRGYYKAITKVEEQFGIEDKAEEFENWCKESDDGAE